MKNIVAVVVVVVVVAVVEAGNWKSAQLPRYWPPWGGKQQFDNHIKENRESRQLTQDEWNSEIDDTVRTLLRAKFAPATVHPTCMKDRERNSRKRYYVPVYFWPQKRVELSCVLCFPHQAHNSEPKQWRVRPGGLMADIFPSDYHDPPSHDKDKWETLDELESVVHYKWEDSDKWERQVRNNPLYRDAKESMNNADRYYYMSAANNPPLKAPAPRFYQEDGKLIILHANPDIQGAYNCYDPIEGDESKFDVIYILLSFVPWFEIPSPYIWKAAGDVPYGQQTGKYNWEGLDHQKRIRYPECDHEDFKKQDWRVGSTFFPHYQWQWYWTPMYLSKGNAKGEERTSPTREDLEGREIPVRIDATNDVKITENNLKIVFSWSPWSPCDACGKWKGVKQWGTRTREGHCFLKKNKTKDPINLHFTAAKFRFLEELDGMLSAPPFKDTGIPLWSGLLPYLTFRKDDPRRKYFPYCASTRTLARKEGDHAGHGTSSSTFGNVVISTGLLRHTFGSLFENANPNPNQDGVTGANAFCIGGYDPNPRKTDISGDDEWDGLKRMVGGYYFDVEKCWADC